MVPYATPSQRHQVFELPVAPLDITEYQLFHGRCQGCRHVSPGTLPDTAPSGQMGPRLLSHIAVLSGQYHLSVRKIQRLLKDQYGETFSIGAISEAQGKVSAMLTPVHQALHQHLQQAERVHVDETTHQRNREPGTRWIWLAANDDAVFQQIRYSRNQDSAKYLLGKDFSGVVISDQCASYHWLDPTKHQFCWAHVTRNLQQMADYSGQGLTGLLGARLVLLCKSVFRTRHRYEAGTLETDAYQRRMHRLRRGLQHWLAKGTQAPCSRYAGRCAYLLKYEPGLWVFLQDDRIPLTNNEAERCLRGSVILRKICYGTSSDRGDKFRSRVLSVVETCKKRRLSPLDVIAEIVSAVIGKQPYPDVFGLAA